MDSKKMSDSEKSQLGGMVKAEIRKSFDWFGLEPHPDLVSLTNMSKKKQLDDKEVVDLVSYVLNASEKTIKVKCEFENEFLEGDYHSGKFFMYGETSINENLENIISIIPSSNFTYEWEGDETNEPVDYSYDLIPHQRIDVNMYRGTLSYFGIVKEDPLDLGAPLEDMGLFNEVQIRHIKDDDPAWKKHIAASYRLYDGKSFRLAFLMAFIAVDSLIELLNDIVVDTYRLHIIDGFIDSNSKNHNEDHEAAVDILEYYKNEVLSSEAYNILRTLENPNRRLIKEKVKEILKRADDGLSHAGIQEDFYPKFYFFEEIRNSLAHGNDYKREKIEQNSWFQFYKDDVTQDIDFDRLYVDLVLHICKFLETLTS